jgi:hypothetical protein
MSKTKDAFAVRLNGALDRAGFGGLSNKVIGQRFDLSDSMVWNLRAGVKLPSMDTAIVISGILGVRLEWLMTGRGPMTDKDAALDYLDISALPDDAKVAMRAAVYSIKEQAAKYGNGGTK